MSVRAPRPARVAVLSPVTGGFYFGGILSGIAHEVAAVGGQVVLIQTLDGGRSGDEALGAPDFDTALAWDGVDGVIALAGSTRRPYLERVRAAGMAVVMAGHQVEGFPARSAMPDNSGGVTALVEHLVRVHGHTRIGFVASLEQTDMLERYTAYRSALHAHGLDDDPALFFAATNNAEGGGRAAAERMVEAGLPATAIVAATDRNALGVIEGLRASGDPRAAGVAVVGFDDIEAWWSTEPALTTVNQEFDRVGAFAARMLLAEMRGDDVPAGRQVPLARLVLRSSCGCRPSRVPVPTVGASATSEDLVRRLSAAVSTESSASSASPSVHTGAAHLERAVREALAGDDETAATALGAAVELLVALGPTAESLQRLVTAVTDHIGSVLAPPTATSVDHRDRLVALLTRVPSAFWLAHTDSHLDRAATLERTIAEQYAVSMSLLDRRGVDPRALHWMSSTSVRLGCLAVWEGVPGQSLLRVTGIYDPREALAGSAVGVGSLLPSSAFPAVDLVDQGDPRSGEITFVIPVRASGTDWGVLAVVGSIDARSRDARASYNHWAALLAVAFEQERLLEDVLASEERYAVAARATDDGLWEWDLRRGTTYYSERCRQILGCDGQAQGREVLLGGVHPDDAEAVRAALSIDGEREPGQDRPVELELRMRTADGSHRWVQCRAIAVSAPGQPVHRLVGSLSDIDDRKVLEEQLRRTALHDAVTGLPNRTQFMDRLHASVGADACHVPGSDGIAVLFMDLDGFKQVNDTLGHAAGDELLFAVAEQLRSAIRSHDTAARFGGDEFAVLLHTSDVASVLAVVRRIQQAIARPVMLGGEAVSVTASVGIATARPGGASADELLRDADAAMYRAKAHRRGSWAAHGVLPGPGDRDGPDATERQGPRSGAALPRAGVTVARSGRDDPRT
ncbi:MAG: diguanylate cyclase with sensor [Actinotalea sp.]|nr:diguanylate cyclase with sensor [Actinotalea sp.]